MQQNVERMTRANLEQTKVSLDVWLDSYEDILFQVYTDDYIVELVDKINAGEDVANNRKLLRKTLRGLFYTKDYVKTISVITESGELVFYDQLTASTTSTSWMDSIEMSQEELYAEISGDNATHLSLPEIKWFLGPIPALSSISATASLIIGTSGSSAVW